MVEESFSAPTPQEAFALARKKYGGLSEIKLLRAVQQQDDEGRLHATIVVSVPQEAYLESIGIDEEAALVDELVELREQMDHMKTALQPQKATIDTVREMMLRRGLRREWLDAVLESIQHDEMAREKSLLIAYLLEEIDAQLRVIAPASHPAHAAMMLIGPTGVGKTTTVAKLAAHRILDPTSPQKTAILNLDTFRVGAHEQLEYYASTMGVAYHKVHAIDEAASLLASLQAYDCILIDTAGVSPYDTHRLLQTTAFLEALPAEAVAIVLVLSATAKYDDLMAVYEHFSFAHIDSVILTKIDETHAIGDAVGFLLKTQLPVRYISTGQTVPDDLIAAEKEVILERFVEALRV
jgi:flagellar biosynthesis protein FlhF